MGFFFVGFSARRHERSYLPNGGTSVVEPINEIGLVIKITNSMGPSKRCRIK